ncbi:MAG: cob(I)yrinic acid a,c-diamide adenosyltransferase [Selenomonadaceae bacterium]|nr:cob(I)yrinic acid a,c-diamide adenosyltransferase [Selenomonadaceae bacterium]MBR3723726.1 cob(I)yrinic acid a,c-diamide adenosyltransferase [Selenomonadaceae bacterium]
MSVYTKTGDKGETGLYTGERVKKNSLRVSAYGAVDEAAGALSLARALSENAKVKEKIFALQKLLPLLMADLASLNQEPMITSAHIEQIEREMDEIEGKLPPLKCFIISGNTKGGGALDLARGILRRAEREYLTLKEVESLPDIDGIFMNRLSDYVFLLMRMEENV